MPKYEQLMVNGLRGEQGSTTPKADPLSRYQLGADNYGQLVKEVVGGTRDALITNPVKDYADLKTAINEGDGLEAALIGVGYIPEIGQSLKNMGRVAKRDIFVPADDHDSIMRAEELRRSGASADDIWRELQLVQFDEADGWKKEIPDYLSRHTGKYPMAGRTKASKLGKSLEHPELFEAEPWAKDMPVMTKNNFFTSGILGNSGGYEHGDDIADSLISVDAPDPEKWRDIALHELQHGIQNQYGWTTGSNIDWEHMKLVRGLKGGTETDPALVQRYNELLQEQGRRGWTDDDLYGRMYELDISNPFRAEASARYLRSGGEAESRLVQLRKDMDEDQLRAVTPRLEDVLRQSDFELFGLKGYSGPRSPIFKEPEPPVLTNKVR